jgi:hypothetical protein
MREFVSKLEEAKALCKLELAGSNDPKAVRTLRFAIAEIDEIIWLVRKRTNGRPVKRPEPPGEKAEPLPSSRNCLN